MAVATSTALLVGAAVSAASTAMSMAQQRKAQSAANAAQQRQQAAINAANQAAEDKAANDAALAQQDLDRKKMGRTSTILSDEDTDMQTKKLTVLGGK